MQKDSASPAELLEVAGGNLSACFFLLGYLSGDIPPDRIAAAITAWRRQEQNAEPYELLIKERFPGFERLFEK
jgi:hypothetical protein